MKVPKIAVLNCANHAYRWTYGHLLSHGVSPELAQAIAKDAGDALGNALLRDLPVNGVEITERSEGVERRFRQIFGE